MEPTTKILAEAPPSISHTVSSVTDLPIPSPKSARDNQQKLSPKTPPIPRRPSRIKHRPQDDIEVQSLLQGDDTMRQDLEDANAAYLTRLSLHTQPHSVHLADLPVEVQEGVIDHLAGQLIGTAPNSSTATGGTRNWSTAMRHPRRKQLSDLALVSIKVKGTCSGLAECRAWFTKHDHLRVHVRHFEVWVPVWEVKASRGASDLPPVPSAFTPRPELRGGRLHGRVPVVVQDVTDMTQAFQQASQNATLEDIFETTRDLFPKVYVLTIEGGQGKRTPLIKAHRPRGLASETTQYPLLLVPTKPHRLPLNPQIGSLVLKGAWNVVRESSDFYLLKTALPNLREYHCTYAKPKTQAYEAMCRILKYFPTSINHLNICLEGLIGKAPSSPDKWRRLYSTYHICNDLGRALLDLESFTFTGRVCSSIFRTAREAAVNIRDNRRLKSVDLIVRNCCRPGAFPGPNNDATGIYQLEFINAFKRLVVEAVRSLSFFTSLHYLRIRFLDLDSPNPLLNPYFHLQGNSVTGIWNHEILALLKGARPEAEYECLDVGDCAARNRSGFVDHILGGLVPLPKGGRPKSMNVDAYAALAQARV
ncbi:MAG: hypothetical protein Q9219_005401 [cf. Caloplaca sp. 3 TL-2023]